MKWVFRTVAVGAVAMSLAYLTMNAGCGPSSPVAPEKIPPPCAEAGYPACDPLSYPE